MCKGQLYHIKRLQVSPSFLAGFNVETIDYKGTSFTAWDLGGRDKIVSLTHLTDLMMLSL